MKIINQILLACFVFFLLFVLRDDIRLVYSKFLTSLENEVNFSLVDQKINSSLSQVEIKDNLPENELKKIDTPGALRVIKKIETTISSSLKDHTLTSSLVIKETNESRKANGNLAPLRENNKLDFSAEKKLQDMFAKQYFEHISPAGVGINDLGKQIGYEYILIGENLALGNFDSDKALVDAWMASPGHRANILNPKYTEIGVAVGQGVYEGRNVWMAVSHFGLPESACPAVDQVLSGIVQLNEQEIEKQSIDLADKREKISTGGVYGGKTTNEQIDEYNILVSSYNKLVAETKEIIYNYNQQVKEFNICIQNNS